MTTNQGRVIAAHGQVAEVELNETTHVSLHDILATDDTDQAALLEVVMSKSAGVFYCLVLRGAEQLQRGQAVTNTREQLSVPVGPKVLGRAFDIFSAVHDPGPPLKQTDRRPLFTPAARDLNKVVSPHAFMETGIKAIDFFTPLLVGGKTALVGGAGVGKTVILTELVNRLVVQQPQADNVAVFSAVGERSREAQELYYNLAQAKVLPYTCLILGQMGANPAVRFRTAYAGATLAEYWRDQPHHNVMFFMDNIYRFVQAGHELSMVMNAIPSQDGYQPTLSSEMAALQERLISTQDGTISSFMALFVPSDDLTDSGVRSITPYLDTTIILSREIYQTGSFPAIDLLASTSAALSPNLIGFDHYNTYLRAKQTLEKSSTLDRIVSLVGVTELSPANRQTYLRAQLIQNYMTQDLFVIAEETGRPAAFVPVQDTVQTVKDILAGQYDSVPPADLRFLNSVKHLAEQLGRQNQQPNQQPAPVA